MNIPGYKLEGRLGAGAQGEVYRAIQLSLKRAVALKIVRHDGNTTSAKLLAKEARVLADLDHPGIVRVFDHGEVDGLSYMAMELLEGIDLEKHLKQLASGDAPDEAEVDRDDATVALDRQDSAAVALPPQASRQEGAATATKGELAPDALRRIDHVLWTLETASQICDALATVHAAGVLHRDMKPANIMLVEGRGAVITDFGTVHAPSRVTFTMEAALVGTPAYMSPEQADERALDQRSDLYSLAATIYHCIAGRPPFAERSLTQVLIALNRSEPEALRKINPALPAAFAKVLSKAMAKDARDRFASATELGAALDKVRRGEKLGRLWSVAGMYRRTRRWHLPVAVLMVAVLAVALTGDQESEIRAMIIDDRHAEAVTAIKNLSEDDREEICEHLKRNMPESEREDLYKVLAVAEGAALIKVGSHPDYRAAVGKTNEWCEIATGDLPNEFIELREQDGYFLLKAKTGYLYMMDTRHQHEDGQPLVYHCPMTLRPQKLEEGPVSALDPAILPTGTLDNLRLCAPDESAGWITFEPERFSLIDERKQEIELHLTHALSIHRFEAPRALANNYVIWSDADPRRADLFAHPNEPDPALVIAELRDIDPQSPVMIPATISFYAASRLAGFMACRLPTKKEWLLAAQEGTHQTLPASPSDVTPELARPRELVDPSTRVHDSTSLGIHNLLSFPQEWTVSHTAIMDFMWALVSYQPENHRPFVQIGSSIASLRTGRCGFRLFRNHFNSN